MSDNKHERICAAKERAMTLFEMGLNQDVSCIDAEELGELMDIVKDCCETIKYDEEAEYYKKVVEAMEKNSDPDKLAEYLPETEGRYYGRARDARGRYMYTKLPEYNKRYDDRYDEMHPDRMYYTPMTYANMNGNAGSNNFTDYKNGRAYISRRGYMEAKDKGDTNMKDVELENYLKDLGSDISEMITNMNPAEKQIVKQKMIELSNMM